MKPHECTHPHRGLFNSTESAAGALWFGRSELDKTKENSKLPCLIDG